MTKVWPFGCLAAVLVCGCSPSPVPQPPVVEEVVPEPVMLRVATYNTALSRDTAGELLAALRTGTDPAAMGIAHVIQTVRPDVLLLQEVDADADGATLTAFHDQYLAVAQGGQEPITYSYRWVAPSNTGQPSGVDLDGDGAVGGAGDALGYGEFPGQYGFAILSRFPLATSSVRTFQTLKWSQVPGAALPMQADGAPFYSEAALAVLPVSSKNHVDLAVTLDEGRALHVLASHPTPPVFDGPEDRNGLRNHAEIGLWSRYLDPASTLPDDKGVAGGLAEDSHFVIMGDLNADPLDGDSVVGAMDQVLRHPRVSASAAVGALAPRSDGGAENAQSPGDRGDPAYDTAAWGLRVDYVLPSATLDVTGSGVHWPLQASPAHAAAAFSDHRLVWVDLGVK